MAESTTTRLVLPRWTADTDSPNRPEFDSAFANLEQWAGKWLPSDTLANRPAAAAQHDRAKFWAIDTGQIFVCVDVDGAPTYAWVELPLADHGHDAYVLKSLVDAAGDLLVATGPDTLARLPLGAPGEVPTVNAAGDGLVYGDAGGGASSLRLTMSADQSVAAGTQTKAALDTVGYDDTGEWSATNDRLESANGGLYIIAPVLRWASPPDANETWTILRVNGAEHQLSWVWSTASGGDWHSMISAYPVKLAATDNLEIFVWTRNAVTLGSGKSSAVIVKVA